MHYHAIPWNAQTELDGKGVEKITFKANSDITKYFLRSLVLRYNEAVFKSTQAQCRFLISEI